MTNTATLEKVFDTVLSTPGMNDNIKIQLSISRKNILLLNKVIEQGLLTKDHNEDNSLLKVASDRSFEELKAISEELLTKAGLTEMNEKLKALK